MYNMISVCDQFLINDIKNIFELMICEKILIRNCGDILEFAFHYNCEYLKKVCMEFISNNLSRILESSALDSLSPDILNELSKFYRKYFDLDCYRFITPDSSAISDEDLMEYIKDFELDLNDTNEDNTQIVNSDKKQKNKQKSTLNRFEIEKRNYEREALNSISKKSCEEINTKKTKIPPVSPNNPNEFWMKIDSKKDTPEKKKMVFAAIKSNEIMKNSSSNSLSDSNFVCLKTMLSSPANLEENNENNLRNNFTLADFALNIKSKKNRGISESDSIAKSPDPAEVTVKKTENAWAINNVAIKKDEIIDLKKVLILKNERLSNNIIKSPSQTQEFSLILKTELKEKQSYEMSKSKSLALTQVEEKAIEELKTFYNVAGVFDENIKIFRRHHIKNSINFATWHHQQNEISN